MLDPAPPEQSTKYFWHIQGAYIDASRHNDKVKISSELNEICLKHRQKPKIFQFNSVDVEGVEIDLP
ncbi:hypothetical protein Tcan_04648 [Toxocara canis]|uniref:Uncharacterized protein n=1 Tax=Toxocara canis TaxID=6265 RepID=A0A0B2V9L2_TOXCA|nr:hypothetical protein Tcan_04648 [Toxocara canis]